KFRVFQRTPFLKAKTKFDTPLCPAHEPPGSADIPVCGFTGHSCPVFLECEELATGKQPEPGGWKACPTSRFRGARRDKSSGNSLPDRGEEESARYRPARLGFVHPAGASIRASTFAVI